MTDIDLDELAEGLAEFDQKKVKPIRSAREERVIAGFEDIQRFVEEHGQNPEQAQNKDIFERLYAVRLDQLRKDTDIVELLEPYDTQGLLKSSSTTAIVESSLSDDELLAELGLDSETQSLSQLKHVRTFDEKKAAEAIASRDKCEDFETFKPLFEQVQQELDSGLRETRQFEMKAEIEQGRFFIVGGQKAYVAEKGEITTTEHGRTDARLRVIFDNGTQSTMLMRSLQRALNKDEVGRRITEPTAGPLFSDDSIDGEEASGTIYVLRSFSEHPVVAENRQLVHKIGVTNMPVDKRIAGAHLQPTFLMANVEIVATFELYNINRTKLEKLIHRIFENAQLDIEIEDRFGNPVKPREWFLVPFFIIDEVVERIKDGSISSYVYDAINACMKHEGPKK